VSTKLANPAPLGLMGFGMTTILLNIHNAGYFPIDSMILAMGIFYGGLGQIIVGIMCFMRGDTFGTTAFTSYGLFWLTLVGLILMPNAGVAARFYSSFWRREILLAVRLLAPSRVLKGLSVVRVQFTLPWRKCLIMNMAALFYR